MSVTLRAARGVAWNLVTGLGARALALVSTLFLTRYIAPSQYGEVSAAVICVGSAGMFSHMGFGQYIIAKKARPDETFHALVFHLGLGFIAVMGVVLARHRLGELLGAPGMVRYVPGMAVAQMLDRLLHVPERTILRDLRFRPVAISRSVSEITYAAVALALAPWLQGMAIVVGNIVRYALLSGLFIALSDRRAWLVPVRLRWQTTREMFSFCLPLAAGNIAEYASTRWDNLMVTRIHGTAVMGAYDMAYNFSDLPNGTVGEQIGDVLMPSFATMDAPMRRRGLFRSTALMALIVFPLAVGLGAVAHTLVRTFFDARWIGLVPMLAILSALSVVKPLMNTERSYLQSQQRPRTLMLLSVVKVALILGLVGSLGRLGAEWACLAVVCAFTLNLFMHALVIRWQDGVPVSQVLGGAVGPLLACVPMAAAVVGIRVLAVAHGIDRGPLLLAAEIVAGGLVYVGAAFVFAGDTARDLLSILSRMRGKK